MVGNRWSSGREALIVATSKTGFASAAIGFGGAAGSGIAHAVSAVARIKVNGMACACVHVPASEFPSGLSLPSYVPLIPENEILIVASCTVTELLAIPAAP